MSKLQKKKLKKKLKKQITEQTVTTGVNADEDDDSPKNAKNKTARDTTGKTEKKNEDGVEVSSDEDEVEVPRSQSVPPMKWIEPRSNDPDDDELLDDPSM